MAPMTLPLPMDLHQQTASKQTPVAHGGALSTKAYVGCIGG